MTQMQADRQNPVVGWLLACFVTFGGIFLVQQCTGAAHGDELRKMRGYQVAWVDINGGPDPVIALVPVVLCTSQDRSCRSTCWGSGRACSCLWRSFLG